jgi:HEAT repeat protein
LETLSGKENVSSRRQGPEFTWNVDMKSPRFLSLLLLIPLFAGVSLTGCDKDEDDDTTTRVEAIHKKPAREARVKLSFEPNAKQHKRVAEMTRRLNKDKPYISRKFIKASNARLFTHIVATRDRGFLRVAGMRAMIRVYGVGEGKAPIDADYVAVVQDALRSDNSDIHQLGIAAATLGLSDPAAGASLLPEVLKRAEDKSPAVQFAVVYGLENLPPEARTEPVMKLLTGALDNSNTYIVSTALKSLLKSGKAFTDTAGLMKRAVAFSTHEDAGIRGNAIQLAAALASADAAAAATQEGAAAPGKSAAKGAPSLQGDALRLALAGIRDADGFVRAAACRSLGELGNKAAVHALLPLTKDLESSRYVIKGFKDMSEVDDELIHQVGPIDAVADEAQAAIRKLGGDGVKLEDVSGDSYKEALTKNAASVQAWYAETKSSLPKASTLPAVKLPTSAAGKHPDEATKSATKPAAEPAAAAAPKAAKAVEAPAAAKPAAAQPQ